MAQLAERLLPTQEVHGVNPVIGKINCFKDDIEQKRGLERPLKRCSKLLKTDCFKILSCPQAQRQWPARQLRPMSRLFLQVVYGGSLFMVDSQ